MMPLATRCPTCGTIEATTVCRLCKTDKIARRPGSEFVAPLAPGHDERTTMAIAGNTLVVAHPDLPAEFHDFRDRGDPMVKFEPSRPDHDLTTFGSPLKPGS